MGVFAFDGGTVNSAAMFVEVLLLVMVLAGLCGNRRKR